MPIRNIWNLEPGECFAAERLAKIGEVFFPMHDIGGDLLVVKGEKHVGIQVKESRYYVGRKWRSGHVGHSWHQIRKKKLLRSEVDFYIFLTYLNIPKRDWHARFEIVDGKTQVLTRSSRFRNCSQFFSEFSC